MRSLWLWMGLLVLIVAGCAPGGASTPVPTQALELSTSTPIPTRTPPAPATATPPPGPDTAPPGEAASPVPVQAQVISAVLADLAARLEVSAGDIDVAAAEAVAWTALDCDAEVAPITSPNRVAGFQVVLAYGEQRYNYRAAAEGSFLLCEDADQAVAGDPVILDTNLTALVELAAHDLAERLDLPYRRVFLVDAYPITWPDASIGCALTGEEYPPAPVEGYRIVLRVGSELYDYHANYRQVFFCPAEAVRLPTVMATSEAAAAQE